MLLTDNPHAWRRNLNLLRSVYRNRRRPDFLLGRNLGVIVSVLIASVLNHFEAEADSHQPVDDSPWNLHVCSPKQVASWIIIAP